jgi:hypothetical protein
MGRTSLECSNDSGDDVAVTAQNRSVGNALEHVEEALESPTFGQSIVGMDS